MELITHIFQTIALEGNENTDESTLHAVSKFLQKNPSTLQTICENAEVYYNTFIKIREL